MKPMDLSGKTALVTGASAGIGRDLARLLGREVAALVLVARRRDRLEDLATELTAQRPGLRVVVRAVDLLDRPATGAALDELEQQGERIDVLVNNAGFGDYAFFQSSSWPKIEQMLELNVVSTTYLLHRLVPGMAERGFGAILNVGSSAGMIASPQMGAYSATKAYVNLLSDGLRAELAGTGVSVTVLCPGPVPTEFQRVAGRQAQPMPKVFWVDSTKCAEDALEAMKRGRARVIPGLPMQAAVLALEATPKAVVRPVLARVASRLRQA
jgi:uncharacterized protein